MKKIRMEHIFVVLALVFGICLAIVVPPLQVCDGYEHMVRSMDVSYGNIIGSFVNITHNDGEVKQPANMSDVNYQLLGYGESKAEPYIQNLKSQSFSEEDVIIPYRTEVTAIYYWPQGLGIWLGRVLNMSMYTTILLARLMNLLVYVVIVYIAIKIIPVFKRILFFIALFPMTIYIASSISQDALLNALCFLFTALCFRIAYGEIDTLNWKDTLKLGSLLAVIFICKYVYVFLGLLVFMIPMSKFGSKRDYWKNFVIALMPLIIMGVLLTAHIVTWVDGSQAVTGDMTQLQYILSSPLEFIRTFVKTIWGNFSTYIFDMSKLASFQYVLNGLDLLCPLILVWLICTESNQAVGNIKTKDRIVCVVAPLLMISGMMITLYIADGRINPVGADVIQGFQGRYMIAVMPAFCMGIHSNYRDREIVNLDYKVAIVTSAILIYSILVLVVRCYA